jgi:hypothetical protein
MAENNLLQKRVEGMREKEEMLKRKIYDKKHVKVWHRRRKKGGHAKKLQTFYKITDAGLGHG